MKTLKSAPKASNFHFVHGHDGGSGPRASSKKLAPRSEMRIKQSIPKGRGPGGDKTMFIGNLCQPVVAKRQRNGIKRNGKWV